MDDAFWFGYALFMALVGSVAFPVIGLVYPDTRGVMFWAGGFCAGIVIAVFLIYKSTGRTYYDKKN